MRVCFLFAPVFRQNGIAVAQKLSNMYQEFEVDGLVTGNAAVHNEVKTGLGALSGELYHLDKLERGWLSETPEPEAWEKVITSFAPEKINRVLVSDRHVGAGFVVGGTQARSALKHRMLQESVGGPENYLCHLLHWSLALLERRKPDVLFLYAVAGAPALALIEAAQVTDVPVRVLTPTRVGHRFSVDTDPYAGLAKPVRLFRAAREGRKEISQKEIDAGRDLLRQFSDQPVAPGYITEARKWQERQTLIRALLRSAIRIFGSVTGRDTKTVRAHPFHTSLYDLQTSFRRGIGLANEKRYMGPIPEGRRYVFYPLHVDPEASTMVAAPWHTNQLAIIEGIAKSLPLDCCLVVKEHWPMIGKRPRGFYRRIAQMPKVRLVSDKYSSFELIRGSSLVCAITGTAGWEACLLGVPALILGTPHYTNLPRGVTHCSDLSRLPVVVPEAMEQEACPKEDLEIFLAAIYACSFELPNGFLWGQEELEESVWNECAQALAREIVLSLK